MEVEQERRGAVQVLRINRPEARNALNPPVVAGLGLGIAKAEADPEVRAVVLTGTGDRAFCAGMDLRGFAEGGGGGGDRAGAEAFSRFIRQGVSKPVIGAANATAVAGGFELLLACDMVVASEKAMFGLPEVKRGLFPAGGGIQICRRIPMAVALELALTGDAIDARRAQTLGLVNRVVPPGRVLEEAVALAERIGENGPLAVEVIKRLMLAVPDVSREEAWRQQSEVQAKVFGSEDAKEGARAFIEKRPPRWTGR